jgi:hypothetical protein
MNGPTTATILTPEAALELARAMRMAGVQRFVLTHDRFSAVLSPPPPAPVEDLSEKLAELPAHARKEFLEGARKEYENDLYGASL